MPAKFVVKKGTTGKFRFNLVSANGQVIASSEAYESKASALNGIKAVLKAAADSATATEDTTTAAWAKAEAERKAAETAKKAAAKAKKAPKKAAAPRAKKAAAPAPAPTE
ncbi:MAG: YegP family protein [Acidimicrobiales bacterium]